MAEQTGKGWELDAVLRALALAALISVAAAVLAVSMALHGPWAHAAAVHPVQTTEVVQ